MNRPPASEPVLPAGASADLVLEAVEVEVCVGVGGDDRVGARFLEIAEDLAEHLETRLGLRIQQVPARAAPAARPLEHLRAGECHQHVHRPRFALGRAAPERRVAERVAVETRDLERTHRSRLARLRNLPGDAPAHVRTREDRKHVLRVAPGFLKSTHARRASTHDSLLRRREGETPPRERGPGIVDDPGAAAAPVVDLIDLDVQDVTQQTDRRVVLPRGLDRETPRVVGDGCER